MMIRTVVLILAAAAVFAAWTAEAGAASGRTLVVFYSLSGNTAAAAKIIQKNLNCDLFELKPVKPYPSNYNEAVDVAKKEQQANARPALATELPKLGEYGTVFLGYPNWWGTMPMALFTLLDNYDFTGKTIIPFCTHGGSSLGRSVDDIKNLCPKAKVLKGFSAFGNLVDGAGNDVDAWLHGLGIATVK